MKFSAVDNLLAPAAQAPDVLLIGYGNLLRSDDGVGPAIVSRLAASFFDNPRCAFLMPHHLTPELGEHLACVAERGRVLFVDASVEQPAGHVCIRRLSAQRATTAPLGHSATPEALLALCKALYQKAPSAWSIAIGVANLAVGDRLSPAVSKTASRLCRRLSYRVRRWCLPQQNSLSHKEIAHVCS